VQHLPLSTVPACGAPLIKARFKSEPSDFCVHEQLSIDFTGEGEHLYLQIEKTDRNTADVVKALRRCFKVIKKDVGFSGQKDKQAVTSQWFSVRTPLTDEPLRTWLASDDAPPFRLLDSQRHQKKLRLGAHDANRFVITLRDVELMNGVKDDLTRRIEQLKTQGFPNYYGPQRFGRNGSNVAQATKWLTSTEQIPQIPRERRSLFLSAVRSAAFNHVLKARVTAGDWNQLRPGELCALNGTNSVFTFGKEDRAATEQRLAEFDVHPSAPLIGKGESLASSEALDKDNAALNDFPQHSLLEAALTKLRVEAGHRATRALCSDLSVQWLDDSTIETCVTLAPGVFATTLLAEWMQEHGQ